MLKIIKILFCTICVINGYKILVVFPVPSKSHAILGSGVVTALLNDGHQVTYVTPYLAKEHVNLTQIDISENMLQNKQSHLLGDVLDNAIGRLLNNEPAVPLEVTVDTVIKSCYFAMTNDNFQTYLKHTNDTFHAVISEWIYSEIFSGLGPLFNSPLIWYSPMDPDWMPLQLVEGRTDPSTTGSIYSKETPPFDFLGRMKELILRVKGLYHKNWVLAARDERNYENVFKPLTLFRGIQYTPYELAKYNASLMLGNSHPSYSKPTLLPESYKAIGGHHVGPNYKPLSQELKDIMDNAQHGVIYFSLGSNIKGNQLPITMIKDILKAFGTLKQTVIWKFDEEVPNTTKNVHIIAWVPQTGVLAHPNCVLFITHGGILSLIESVHFGVPIIGLPVFADQYYNLAKAADKGFGIKIDWSYNVVDDLMPAIREVLSNPLYIINAKENSKIYHDRLVSPEEELVYWVKHVIETEGAPHLRSAALMLSWYQRMYLDWAALLVFTVLAILYLMREIVGRFKRKRVQVLKIHKNK